MDKKILSLVMMLAMVCSTATILSAEVEKVKGFGSGESIVYPVEVTVSTFCRTGSTIRYQIRELGKGEYQNGQYVWINGKIIGYVEAKGSKYLIEEMSKLGYSQNQWIFTSWFDRIDRLPFGIFSRACVYRD